MMDFDIIIPLYNSNINDVDIFRLNLKDKGIILNIIICDNSDNIEIRNKNMIESKKKECTYIDMHRNAGLSKAYNRALLESTSDVIVILDDDTIVQEDYFIVLCDSIKKNGNGVYVPMVKSGNTLLSPLVMFGPLIKRVKKCEITDLTRISAFNSGMAITKNVFKEVKYNENLFLDFVDHSFCRECHKRNIPFYYLPVEIQQNYSRETNSLESALTRDKIFKKDVRAYYSYSIIGKIYCEIYLLYRFICNSVHYKKIFIS